jgi:cell division protein FtsW (lipid II flippase)
MHKETIVFFLGIILTLLPFLGIPEEWKTYGFASIGVVLIMIGYLLRRNGERGEDSFTESVPLSSDQIQT